MGARERIEHHSIFLQKVAYRLLTDDSVRLATIGKLVGDHGMFDRDMSTILTMLFAHNNLMSPQLPPKEQPAALLMRISKDLLARGFYLPSFMRRLNHVKEVTNGTMVQESPSGGGESGALDRPLRSLRDKIYETRIHDDGHAQDHEDNNLTKRTGTETAGLVDRLISSVKSLETQGLPYGVSDGAERSSTGRTEFLDARYDEISSKLNTSTDSSAEGDKIQLLYLHPQHLLDDPEWFTQMGLGSREAKLYAVKEEDFPRLEIAMATARAGWKPNDKYVYASDLVKDPGTNVLDQGRKPEAPVERPPDENQLQHREEVAAIEEFSQEDSMRVSAGKPVVRVVSLPFSPSQIDDNYPTIELYDDKAVGPNMTRVTIENINRMRFSGFVDFDNKYRMMIMWANAAGDDKTDVMGRTYKDMLMKILGVHKKQFSSVIGMEPEVHKTKAGASYYFTKPISITQLVKEFNEIRNLINRVNTSIEHQETHLGLEREFNRDINDEELPSYMEESY